MNFRHLASLAAVVVSLAVPAIANAQTVPFAHPVQPRTVYVPAQGPAPSWDHRGVGGRVEMQRQVEARRIEEARRAEEAHRAVEMQRLAEVRRAEEMRRVEAQRQIEAQRRAEEMRRIEAQRFAAAHVHGHDFGHRGGNVRPFYGHR